MQQLLPRSSFNGHYAYRPVRSLTGLSDVTPGQIGGGAGAATSIIQTDTNPNIATSTKIESTIGASLLQAAAYTPPPANVALAIAGAAAELLAAFGVGSGCGQSCVLSTKYANQAEATLKQNLDGYFQGPRYASQQTFALQVFDTIWADLVQQCSAPSLGSAGQACISDRQSGACKWKATAPPPYPGGPAQGACWNWFNGYRDPIAKDVPNPDPPSADSTIAGAGSALSSIATSLSGLSPLLLIGGGLLLVGMMGGDN